MLYLRFATISLKKISLRLPELMIEELKLLANKRAAETRIEENGIQPAIRSRTEGVCGKVFQVVGMALPPTIREI